MKYMYRLSSGEVSAMSTEPNPWPDIDPRFFAVLTDPVTPDGPELDPPNVWDGGVMRNATAAEIAGFLAARDADDNLRDREDAAALFLVEKGAQAKMVRLITYVTLNEINVLRTALNMPELTIAEIRAKARALLDAGIAD